MNIHMLLSNAFDPDVRVYKEAKELVKSGFKVTIHCWDRAGKLAEKEDFDGIQIIRYSVKSTPGSGLKQVPAYFQFCFKVRKALKKESGFILHCHDFDTMLIGLRFKKVCRIFDVHENFNINLKGIKGYVYTYLYRKGLKEFSKIVFVSEQQKEKMPYLVGEDNLIILPNYPRLQDYEPIEKIRNGKLRINYIGVVRDKTSLEVLIKLSDKNYEIGIYGSGIASPYLKELNKQYQAALYGKFDGITDSANIYRNTDVLYCVYDPKNYNWKNAFFVKFYEAIITQTPIIVTKNTLAGDFVSEYGIGAVVSYGDEADLEKSIEYIFDNYENIISNLKKISRNYLWEEVVSNLVGFYLKSTQ